MTHRNETSPAAAKWPPNEPACFGVCCSRHKDCARYAAVDFNSNPAQVFIDNCGPTHTLYEDTRNTVPTVELAAKAGQP